MLPDPWSVDELVARVAHHRSRPIHVLSHELTSDQPTGCWLTTAKADYIVVAQRAGGARRDAIVCHELAHIVLEHSPRSVVDQAGLAALAPHSPPELIARFLPRDGYDTAIERDAEDLATRLIAHAGRTSPASDSSTESHRLSNRLR